MKKQEEGIIVREEVLGYFGKTEPKAIALYKEYIIEGVELKEDYEGGGLIRSAGGIGEAIERRQEDKEMYDDRILGDGDFVEGVLGRIDGKRSDKKFKNIVYLIESLSKYYEVEGKDIIESRKKKVREARSVLVYIGNKYLGKSVTAMGQMLGITQEAASIAKEKGERIIEVENLLKKLIE